MKKIYIVLTYTGTMLSRIIKIATRDEFAHVSISLDKNLNSMYSFGRLNPYNPFFCGFLQEGITYGTFKRFEKTTISKVYTLEVTDYQYKKLRRAIKDIEKYKINYRFNIAGLVTAKFRFKLNRNKCFYCAEFVKNVMDEADIDTNLPNAVKPEDFKYLDNIDLFYSGMLKDYNVSLLD